MGTPNFKLTAPADARQGLVRRQPSVHMFPRRGTQSVGVGEEQNRVAAIDI